MSAKKITIPVHAFLELDPADFAWVDGLDPEELKRSIYELLEYRSKVELGYWRYPEIHGTLSFVCPSPQQLKAARVESNREA